MGAVTVFGEVQNYQSAGANQFYMSEDGTISTNSADGKPFVWQTNDEIVSDTKTGETSTFGDFLGSLGSSVNSFLDIVNKTAQTYENTTGSKLITTSSNELKSTGKLNDTDMNTLSMIINSSINQLKKNALYIGMGITAIILTAVVLKKKRAK